MCLAIGNNLNKEKDNSKYLPHVQNTNLDFKFLKKEIDSALTELWRASRFQLQWSARSSEIIFLKNHMSHCEALGSELFNQLRVAIFSLDKGEKGAEEICSEESNGLIFIRRTDWPPD